LKTLRDAPAGAPVRAGCTGGAPNRVAGCPPGAAAAAGGLGGFFPPILMGLVRDATDAYSIGFMLLSEIALGCLVVACWSCGAARRR
jgi:nitrate/nitrite transporter NarK